MDASERSSLMVPILLALAVAAALAAPLVNAQQTDMGSWQQHQVTFDYLGDVDGTHYSCDGLVDDLTFLLKQSGARVNKPVQVYPCVRGYGSPSVLLSAKLDFSTFAPAAEASGQAASVPGTWRKVLFSAAHSSPQLHFGDCELVSEFKDKLLKYFATQDVNSNLVCIPYQADGGLYGLSFQTFVPSDTPHRAVGGG